MVPELFRWFGWRRPIEILRHHIEKQGPLNSGVNAGARRAIRSLAADAEVGRGGGAKAVSSSAGNPTPPSFWAAEPSRQICLTCRPALRWTLGAAILAKVLRPKYHLYFIFLASFVSLFRKRCPCHAISCNRFGFVGTSRSVPVQLFGSRVPSSWAHVAGRCTQGMIIRPTLTHSQTQRSMQAHSPAETASFGVLARRLRLVGADARAPPGPTRRA
jgi:hypothetical protein